MHRRTFLHRSLALAAAWPCADAARSHLGWAAQTAEEDFSTLFIPKADAAVNKALGWLATRQQADGAFGSAGYGRNVAVGALCGMAMMAGGSTPGRGPYGEHVARCVEYLLACAQESGFIVSEEGANQSPMYGHGFATLFLAEAYGMSDAEDIRQKVSQAVRLIVDTQNDQGGWRYQPIKADADLSVTICQVMALRAARNAGIHVPPETIERCIAYVKQCQNPDGGFMYMLPAGQSEFPRSAAGVVALHSAGIYEGPEVDQGMEYLMQLLPRMRRGTDDSHFFYGHYYAVQAMWQTGGEAFAAWYPAIRDLLLSRQSSSGAWDDPICPEYGSAMACIILQMPVNYLPIFQR